MSFDTFRANPKSYLKTHEMHVANNPATLVAMTAGAQVANAAHGHSVLWTQNAGNFLTMSHAQQGTNVFGNLGRKIGLLNKRLIQYATSASAGDIGFRYLPFMANQCTYMTLDANASLIVTGPLSGCSIAAGRTGPGGAAYLFHANANGPPPGGVAVKQAMIDNAAALVGVPQAHLVRCDYGPGNQYNGMGFVFGRLRPGGIWKFYIHSANPAPGGAHVVDTTKFGQI